MDTTVWASTSLSDMVWGAVARNVLSAAVEAVDPATAVQRYVQRDGDLLRVADQHYHLSSYQRVFAVAVGKAAFPMMAAVAGVLGDRLTGGLLVARDVVPHALPHITVQYGGHPLPDAQSVAAASDLVALLAQTTADDLVVFLLSGGASALLTLPVPGVTLAALRHLTDLLLGSGAPIEAMNVLRKHLDQVKGGRAAQLAMPATQVTLLLSDVIGNRLDMIGSGPTLPDPSTFADALRVLAMYGLLDTVDPAIRHYLETGRAGGHEDTPTSDAACFANTQHVLVGSNRQAALAAAQCAAAQGWHARILTTELEGEARTAGHTLGAIVREMATGVHRDDGLLPLAPRPACLVVGGETTVTLRGNGHGLGGRNTELALAVVPLLAGVPNAALITLATDGSDGPTDAAGAVVTGYTLRRAQQQGLDAAAMLAQHDAYNFFAPLGDLLKPGATGTNVNDLVLLLAW